MMTTYRTSYLRDELKDEIARARLLAAQSPRWLRAIEKAEQYLLDADVLAFDPTTGTLVVPSATRPDVVYAPSATGCQCEAAAFHRACWHRAAARLVERALAHGGTLEELYD